LVALWFFLRLVLVEFVLVSCDLVVCVVVCGGGADFVVFGELCEFSVGCAYGLVGVEFLVYLFGCEPGVWFGVVLGLEYVDYLVLCHVFLWGFGFL